MSARLYSREAAAAYLGVGLTTFAEKIEPSLRAGAIEVGRRVLYDVKELDRWVEAQKAGSSAGVTGSDTFVSATKARAMKSPRSREILGKLRSKQPGSTRRLFPVGGGR